MTPGARLQTAIEYLDQIETDATRPADAILADGFRKRRYAGSKDRAEIAELVYGVLRRRAQVDWWLDRFSAPVSGRSRVFAYSVLTQRLAVSALPARGDADPYAPDAADPAERDLLQHLEGAALDDPSQPDAVRSNFPDWAAGRLSEQFPGRIDALAAALSAEAPVDIRANSLKTTREEVQARLAADGIETTPCPLSPIGLRLTRRRPLTGTAAFKDGLFEVQDEGSQLVALLVDAQPGQKVVDFCAGAGGKTLALAGRMENRGRIIACDTSEVRLGRAADRLKRAGAFTVERRVLSSARDKWVKRRAGRFDGGFDRVLVDAPCSGTGTWRRNPDQKWRQSEQDLAELTALQTEILSSAARLVSPGGRLIYATCSLLREENADRISAFLAERSDFFLSPYGEIWKDVAAGAPPTDGEMLTLTPAEHGTDGFFVAILGRKV